MLCPKKFAPTLYSIPSQVAYEMQLEYKQISLENLNAVTSYILYT